MSILILIIEFMFVFLSLKSFWCHNPSGSRKVLLILVSVPSIRLTWTEWLAYQFTQYPLLSPCHRRLTTASWRVPADIFSLSAGTPLRLLPLCVSIAIPCFFLTCQDSHILTNSTLRYGCFFLEVFLVIISLHYFTAILPSRELQFIV